MSQTLFQKIINGEIPCHKVYEDDFVFSFLDIQPLSLGHVLVVPKEPAPTLDVLSDDAAAALGRALPKICRALIAVTGVKDFNVLQNNGAIAHQAVFHVHFHIIPKPNADEGLFVRWPSKSLDPKEGQEIAEKLRAALDSSM